MDSAFPAPRAHPIDRLWRLMTDVRLLWALLALLAAAVLLAVLLPQLPAELGRSEAAERWLAETSSRFGPLGGGMRRAGLFDLRDSWWLRGLLGLLAFVLLLRLVEALGRLAQPVPATAAAEARRWPLQSAFAAPSPLPAALAEIAESLQQEGWWVTTAHNAGEGHIVAERSRVGLWAGPLLYGAALLALAALWLDYAFGWQEGGLVLVPGRPVALQRDGTQVLTLTESADGVRTVTLQTGDGRTSAAAFTPQGRARLPGMVLQVTGQGQTLTASAQTADGAALALRLLDQPGPDQTAVTLVFDQPRAERSFLAPARQVVFSVVAFPALPERGFAGPTFLVQAFQGDQRTLLFNEFVEGGASLALGQDRYDLRSGQYLVARASHAPGRPLLAAAGLAAAAGVLLALLRPTGRLYVHLREARRGTAVTARLAASPLWRQGARWLNAWAATYGDGQPLSP